MKSILIFAFFGLIFAQSTEPSQPTQCTTGICCSDTGMFKTPVNICRPTNNPCEQPTYCSGTSAECPLPEKKIDGASCLGDGLCQNGHCVRRQCIGECCANGKALADGDKCANAQGFCHKGTCMIVLPKPVPELTPEQQKALELSEAKARKQIAESLDELLTKQERVVIRRERRNLLEQQQKASFLESISDIPVINSLTTIASTATGKVNEVANLATGNEDNETPFYKTSTFYTLVAVGAVVIAALALFGVIGGGKKEEKKVEKRRKPVVSEADTDSLYEPPAF